MAGGHSGMATPLHQGTSPCCLPAPSKHLKLFFFSVKKKSFSKIDYLLCLGNFCPNHLLLTSVSNNKRGCALIPPEFNLARISLPLSNWHQSVYLWLWRGWRGISRVFFRVDGFSVVPVLI